jgi:hypothetical protein
VLSAIPIVHIVELASLLWILTFEEDDRHVSDLTEEKNYIT